MPMFLSILAVALAGSTPATALASTVSIDKKVEILNKNISTSYKPDIEINNESILLSKNLSKSIVKLQSQFSLNEADTKSIIESSIKYNDDHELVFDLSKLKTLEKTEFFQLVSSNNSLISDMLSKLLEGGLLEYNLQTQRFNFKDVVNIAPLSAHIWAEHEWYWFLYWELHFDHHLSSIIATIGDVGSDLEYFMDIIDQFQGPWGVGARIIVATCQLLSFYFGDRDEGNGVCIGWDAVIPRGVVAR